MPTLVSLPPPVTFKHKETLHRVELPPLARFLHTLTTPPQLIKLHEILNRYRTPKSYHRVDVREVGSSELPPADSLDDEEPRPNGNGNGTSSVNHDATLDLRDGEPIELEEGVTIEEALGSVGAVKLGDVDPEAEASSPEATHPLPPSGPKRRIRELRLDLRTLDPAALFTLEKWRREVLKLENLPFDHPDSIWYRSPTPEPVVKKGRPRKQRTSASASVQVEDVAMMGLRRDDGAGTQAETPNTMADIALGQAFAMAIGSADVPEVIDGVNGVEAFDRVVDGPEIASGSIAPDAGSGSTPVPVPPQSALADLFGTEDPVQSLVPPPPDADANVEAEVAEAIRPLSLSPEPILVDAYDHDPEKDPDYAPAPERSAPTRRSGRPSREKPINAKASASSSRSGFARVASPVPMLATRPSGSSKKSSAFVRVPSPISIIPGQHSAPLPDLENVDPDEIVEIVEIVNPPRPRSARMPVVEIAHSRRRLSVSPSRSATSSRAPRRSHSPPPPPRPAKKQFATSSIAPIAILDSPEPEAHAEAPVPASAPALTQKRTSAFQPFVREPMRMPASASGSARPQWLTDLPDLDSTFDDLPSTSRSRQSKGTGSKSTGTGRMSGTGTGTGSGSGSDGSRHKKARKSNTGSNKPVDEDDRESEDDISIIEPSEVGSKTRKRREVEQDDEWADFMF